MTFHKLSGAASALAAMLIAAPHAVAGEGYFMNGYGAVNKSMAGAGVASGFDAMSQAVNPASLALVETQLTIDLSVSGPSQSIETIGAPSGNPDTVGVAPGSFDSEGSLAFLPTIGNVWEIDDSSSWGWALYGNNETNTQWEQPLAGLFGDGPAGIDLQQAFLQVTYAQEVSPGVYLGFSPIIAIQRFQAEGLSAFGSLSSDPAHLTSQGYDMSWGYGGKIGVQADIGAGFSFGAAYQSEIFMTDLDKYSGLIANGGEFDIPATLQVGFAWQAESGFLAALDYKRIFYGDIDALSNSIGRLNTGGGVLFGSPGGPGFGWDDIDIVKLGLEVPVGSAVKLRAGASMNTATMPGGEVALNILMPALQERHFTAGMTVKLGENHAINLAGMYSPPVSIRGVNALDPVQTIDLETSQWEATVGWAWSF